MRALAETVEYWLDRYFDSPEVQAAFQPFSVAVLALARWMDKESHPVGRFRDEPTYAIRDPNERGSQDAFESAQGEGVRLAASVIDAWRELERIANQHRLGE
jgi:hypothetical protein